MLAGIAWYVLIYRKKRAHSKVPEDDVELGSAEYGTTSLFPVVDDLMLGCW
jgi:hypothetical protein